MPDVVERANAELIRAATTKAEGCLIAAFKEEQDPGQLRLRVQSEIRALRNEGGDEKTLLHPLVLRRALAALSMR